MNYNALIEAMARAAAGNVTKEQWDANPEEHWRLHGMSDALAVARKAVMDEIITACAAEHLASPNGEADAAYDHAVDDCIDAIRRSLSD